MKKSIVFYIIFIKSVLLVSAQTNEFYGSFASWANLKRDYHAIGDGIHDDTKALQAALDGLGKNNNSPVLFIPEGTYRITSTLTMQSRMNIAIIGENPLYTIIKWDGDSSKKMFLLNGVSYSEFSRITWDGSNKALVAVSHEWDMKVPYANSGTQHTDEIFRDLQVGLKSGANMDAEFSIRRCRFYNCSSTGISLQGPNALDWWIWDCYFENCNAGVANNLPAFGAGNFHIYRSIFKNSKLADISLGNSNYFSFRDNISYNSKQFISASQFSNTSPITIQHNLIINQNNKVTAYLFTKGNILFLDNTFVTPDSNKNYVINNVDYFKTQPPDLTMIGNLFTAKDKIVTDAGGRFINIDNQYGISAPSIPSPTPKAFETLVNYPVYEVNNKMSTADVQAVINAAAAKNIKSIIHFSYGDYKISTTIKVPPGAPLILIGDGFSSLIKWSGDTVGPVLEVNYPAKTILRNLKIDGNGKVDGVLVLDNDNPGNTFYANELLVYSGVLTNLLINNFANTDFRFENLQHNYCAKGTSVKMIGTGIQNASFLKIFGCASVNNTNTYGVDKNGRIIVYDDWFENGPGTHFMDLTNNGEFILNGAKIATNSKKDTFININNFSGKALFTEIIYNAPNKVFRFLNEKGNAHLLTLGTLSWSDSTLSCYNIVSAKNNYGLINDRFNIGQGSISLPNDGDQDTAFIKDMFTDLRQTLVSAKPLYSKKGSRFEINRVMIQNSLNNFRVEKTE